MSGPRFLQRLKVPGQIERSRAFDQSPQPGVQALELCGRTAEVRRTSGASAGPRAGSASISARDGIEGMVTDVEAQLTRIEGLIAAAVEAEAEAG